MAFKKIPKKVQFLTFLPIIQYNERVSGISDMT
jgi:hypothetical protein